MPIHADCSNYTADHHPRIFSRRIAIVQLGPESRIVYVPDHSNPEDQPKIMGFFVHDHSHQEAQPR